MELGVRSTPRDVLAKCLVLLRLSRLEGLSISALAFGVGYLSTAPFRWPAFVAGIVGCLVILLICIHINIYADRVEDRVNRPERVELVNRVGYESIKRLVFGLLIAGGLWACVIACVSTRTTVIVYLVAILINGSYSYGLRLKRHYLSKALGLATATPLAFAFGWSMNELKSTFPVIVLFLGYMSAISIGTLNDIADSIGDRVAGLRTVVNTFRDLGLIYYFVWFNHYLLIVLLIVFHVVEPKYLSVLATLPLAIYGVVKTQRAQSPADREHVFGFGMLYNVLFKIVVFLTMAPTVPVLLLAIGVIVYPYLVTALLNRSSFSVLGLHTR